MSTRRWINRRTAVAAAGLSAALAIAAPVGTASAATPVPPALPALPALPAPGTLPALGALPAFTPAGLSFFGPQVAIGPTVIGSVFNGGTSVVVSTDPPVNSGNVIGSP